MACSRKNVTTRVYKGELRWKSNVIERKQGLGEDFDRVTFSLRRATSLQRPLGTLTVLFICTGEPCFPGDDA
jgi:hypothetical protein